MPRKGITPVIAIVLLLMMTVAAAGGAYAWTSGLLDDFMGTAEDETERGIAIQNLVCYNQAPTVGEGAYIEVFFQNTGTKQLDLDPVDMNVRARATGDINFTLTRTGLSLARQNLGPRIDFKTGDGFAEPGSSAAYIVGLDDRLEPNANYEIEFVFTDEENVAHAEYCQTQSGGQDTYDTQQVDDDEGDGGDGVDGVGRSVGITPGSLEGPDSVEDDETVVVSAELMNNGSERARETVTFTIQDGDSTVRDDSIQTTLDPGESTELSSAFSPPENGSYTIAVACDGCTFNTRETIDLEVVQSTVEQEGPYLVLRSIDAPGTVGTGESFDAATVVENTGGSTGSVEVTVALEDGAGQVLSEGTVSTELAPNAEETLMTPFEAPGQGIEGTLRASCSVCNESGELTRQIAIEPPARPDTGIESVQAPGQVERNGTVDVYVTVQNDGTAPAQRQVEYELRDGATAVGSGSTSVDVDAGGRETISFEVRFPDQEANLTLQVSCGDCERSQTQETMVSVVTPPQEGGGLPIIPLIVVLLFLIAGVGVAVWYVNQRGEEKEQERQQRRQQYRQETEQQPPRRRERGRRGQDERTDYGTDR